MAQIRMTLLSESKRPLLYGDSDDTDDTEDDESPLFSPPPLSTAYKVLRTVVLVALYASIGTFSEITGPVLPELIAQTHSEYQTLANAVSMKGAGRILGAVLGGLTIDRWMRYIDITTALTIVLYTGTGVATAYAKDPALLFVVFFLQGGLRTWMASAISRIVLVTWKDKSAGPLHAAHLGYSLGSVIVPQVVSPFLDSRFSGGFIKTGYNSSCRLNDSATLRIYSIEDGLMANATQSNSLRPLYPANLVKAYWILSGFGLLLTLIFAVYHIYGRATKIYIDKHQKSTKLSLKESLSPSSCSPLHPKYATLIITLLFFYKALSVPLIKGFTNFIFSYARDGPCMSVAEATAFESAYFAAVMAGVFGTFLISSTVHMKYILQVEIIGAVTCTLVLFFRGDNIIILWIFYTAFGFFAGPMSPSLFAWANRYIEVTSAAQMVPRIAAAVGEVTCIVVFGYSYQHYGPLALWPFQLVLVSALSVVVCFMQLVASKHGDRFGY